jgi:hypothetical protein
MSIHDRVEELLNEHDLIELDVSLPVDPLERRMLLTPDVNALLVGPWRDDKWAKRCGRLHDDLEVFVRGDLISASLTPYKHETAYLGRLDRPIDEVWDIRSRDPKPAIRVFGRFADCDMFVALTHRERKSLNNRNDWRLAVHDAKTRWNRLFHPHDPPFTGESDIHAYVSTKVFIVGDSVGRTDPS